MTLVSFVILIEHGASQIPRSGYLDFPSCFEANISSRILNWSPVITHQQCDNRQRLMYRWFSLAYLKNR